VTLTSQLFVTEIRKWSKGAFIRRKQKKGSGCCLFLPCQSEKVSKKTRLSQAQPATHRVVEPLTPVGSYTYPQVKPV